MSPERIQRKRTKGWRLPPGAVYVGRPTKWGNPYRPDPCVVMHGSDGEIHIYEYTIADAVQAYRNEITRKYDYRWRIPALPTRDQVVAELRGKDLACWCPLDQPCHADVLLELANA